MRQISWDYIDKACQELADRIKTDGIYVDAVVGIPRGGLIIAVKMSHLLDVPLKLEQKKASLLCDDICDSGVTMRHQKTYAHTITLSIHKDVNSKFTPDYYYEETNEWIQFPWETKNTSKVDYKEKK